MRYLTPVLSLTAAIGLLTLAGCDQIDPLKRPYMWHDANVNALNIAAMAANPADLYHGRDSSRRRSAMDADSVDRLWTGRVPPLPSDTPGSTAGTSTTQGAPTSPTGGGT